MTTDTMLYRYQERLRASLEIIGYVTILSGPVSICRKLCREVIGSNMVTIIAGKQQILLCFGTKSVCMHVPLQLI